MVRNTYHLRDICQPNHVRRCWNYQNHCLRWLKWNAFQDWLPGLVHGRHQNLVVTTLACISSLKMRNDEELDQLVKDVVENDLLMRAVVNEAEMLIFPSVLLPKRYQTFRTKHYLWATFKGKEGQGTASVEQEEDKEKHVSSQLDEVQYEESDQEMILMKCTKPLENLRLPGKCVQEVETCCVQGPANMHLGREAVCTSVSTAVATDATIVANAATIPSEATSFATNTASYPTNHGPIDPSMEAHPSSSSVFGIVVRETPKVQKLIQEFERDGELIAVVQGGAIGVGQWASNITAAIQ